MFRCFVISVFIHAFVQLFSGALIFALCFFNMFGKCVNKTDKFVFRITEGHLKMFTEFISFEVKPVVVIHFYSAH